MNTGEGREGLSGLFHSDDTDGDDALRYDMRYPHEKCPLPKAGQKRAALYTLATMGHSIGQMFDDLYLPMFIAVMEEMCPDTTNG